jgi:hypothetical protein
VQFDRGIIDLLSGVSKSDAYIIDAFGLQDKTVVASTSTVSFEHDFPAGHVFYYTGPHGVTFKPSSPAFEDFLAHLQPAGTRRNP